MTAQIEDYAKCPWAYFSKRLLRLERHEDPDEDMDNLVRGSLLHDALKRFYDAAFAQRGEPILLGQFDASWAEPLLQ
jgi:RecB family exonuclease